MCSMKCAGAGAGAVFRVQFVVHLKGPDGGKMKLEQGKQGFLQ